MRQYTAILPGRELDSLIADQVMGDLSLRALSPDEPSDSGNLPAAATENGLVERMDVPQYSTRSQDMWRVIERLQQAGFSIKLQGNPQDRWRCDLEWHSPHRPEPEHLYGPESDTAPLAVCRAALVAFCIIESLEQFAS